MVSDVSSKGSQEMVKEGSEKYQIVWLHEEQAYGVILQEHAYFALIKYSKEGIEYQSYFEDGDYTVLDEIGFMYIEEEDGQDPLL